MVRELPAPWGLWGHPALALGWWGEAGIDQPCGIWEQGSHSPMGLPSPMGLGPGGCNHPALWDRDLVGQDHPALWDGDLGAVIAQPYGIGIWGL